ncbi:MAG: tRNA preQ1(34) S-adenosylmethionine ribosyltransferase-isomerase QueA [Anaerovoracaceae bacterium]|jgi:S-adenosylmethionine:tRNA ribosyltransferase-isomerase
MKVSDFDYDLPEELIAQQPSDKRDECRLMVLDRKSGGIKHDHFYNITDYLKEGDCLVLNDSRVLPARLFGVKEKTGAHIEFLLIKRIEGDRWETMVRPGRRCKPGDRIRFADDFAADILDYGKDGTRIVEFHYQGIFMERLEQIGAMPLPPYIERPADDADRERYQTVYSKIDGSVAAPTAGLHFTEELLEKVREKGVKLAYVTLHVGIGTFRPVKVDEVEEHHMHFEEYSISQESADMINSTKRAGGRIVSVGTTSTRTVESAAVPAEEGAADWEVKAGHSSTGIFIYPGYEFKIIDSLITNFHLPKSTLLMLISALYDREKILQAYEVAKEEKYRFFSYGDAMLIL